MLEFLDMCGFGEEEKRTQFPRLQEAFARLGLNHEDIERGKSRMTTFYDMDLQGVRRLIGVLVKDLCNIVLMRDEGRDRIVHACMAPGMQIVGSAIMGNSDNVGLIIPNMTFMAVLGGVFDKYVPVLDSAEKQWLKSGAVAHCGMVKSRVGLMTLGLIPRPDLTITAGFACETSPKVNELLEEVHGIPACYVDACQDRELREYPDSTRAISFAAKSMRAATRRIEEVTGFGPTDDMLWKALEQRRPFNAAVGRLKDLIHQSDPVPFRSTHLALIMALEAVPFAANALVEAVDALDTLYDEAQERSRRGVGATPKGAPRVLAMFPHHHTDPRWEDLANRMGLAVVGCDFEASPDIPAAQSGRADPDDPYAVIAQHLHSSFTQPLGGRIKIVLDTCRQLGVDGVLYHYHPGCRYVVGDALIVRDAILKELGIPVLMLEWENFDPRSYNHEQYEAQLEVFRSMMDKRAS
jgi:benzoyl-CoA reductase/2-hydroxyglutaryl-CoA dehydratase subunit BcrC/BadD/HgdB